MLVSLSQGDGEQDSHTNIKFTMKCTDKIDDATLLISSSNNTAVDDMLKEGIEKVTLDDVSNKTPPCDIVSGGEDMNSEKKYTSCDQKFEHTKTGQFEVGTDINLSTCANCGKEGATNTCNKCKQVKYCNAICKKKHKTKHKQDCERRVAELQDIELKQRRVAELRDKLFKDPPVLRDNCPICFQRLPLVGTGGRYKSCCGKVICSGCIHAVKIRHGRVGALCPFCRTPTALSSEENIKRLQKRVEVDDVESINHLGDIYSKGTHGLPQDYAKALELWHRAANRYDPAYFSIGIAYYDGRGVEVDKTKAEHYWERGALGGSVLSRYSLGVLEQNRGNTERAIKHYMISVGNGHNKSLKNIQRLYSNGHVSKDVYTEALLSYQKYLGEVKSSQRDEAAAFDETYKYIE